MTRPAVILLSGGLDSTVCLAHALRQGFSAHALTIDYGQRHRVELEAAARVSRALGAAAHMVLPVPLTAWGGSALTSDESVPEHSGDSEQHIPATYVPARNTIFLSLALAWAETLEARDIFIGVNAIDYSGYPDCRPEYIAAFQNMAALATKAGVQGQAVTVHTPLITLTKAGIIRMGAGLGVDFSLTHSCYDPDAAGRPCGRCDSCALRLKGFREAGVADPLDYRNNDLR
jgi:7-cyano-7-deazaguanine synthase